ncbi:hypothetical protein [Paeniglutamicibacter kerguelensis]|uniref:Uncharacterized protein n=1 Tax=Paeniglutamicibacter kerguelensis TaxID=254788 RepID=A0ABS4XHV8_9MICC|nr:hypothetical protein [Paeniglutamicibacter kerguelensis]MBP2388057.1 hypothetical protein [Paeniglutamicibacter kerguelensis]
MPVGVPGTLHHFLPTPIHARSDGRLAIDGIGQKQDNWPNTGQAIQVSIEVRHHRHGAAPDLGV